MSGNMIDWMMNQWLGLASLAIAVAALVYAALAYHLSKASVVAARASEALNLRIQVRSSLADARRSLQELRSQSQACRADWERHERRHFPRFSLESVFHQAGPRGNTQLERRGEVLLRTLEQDLEAVDGTNADQLEKVIHDAKAASLEIEGLIPHLEKPPVLS